MNGFVSRGFTGRRRIPEGLSGRLPPGQYAEQGFPVLTAGPTPGVETGDWSSGSTAWSPQAGVELGGVWPLPSETVPCDIHCVTKWSKLGTSFGGVSVDTC